MSWQWRLEASTFFLRTRMGGCIFLFLLLWLIRLGAHKNLCSAFVLFGYQSLASFPVCFLEEVGADEGLYHASVSRLFFLFSSRSLPSYGLDDFMCTIFTVLNHTHDLALSSSFSALPQVLWPDLSLCHLSPLFSFCFFGSLAK